MADPTKYAPGKVRLIGASIAGHNVAQWVQNIKVYESMCTPYIKAELTILDNGSDRSGQAGVIASIAERTSLPGAPVQFAFECGEGPYRRMEQRILTVDSHPSEEQKRALVYNIGTIGASYVDDRQSLVQKSFVNTPATAAASSIHQEYLPSDPAPLNALTSAGMIAKDTIGSFPISNQHPFAAIETLLKRATYGGMPTPTVYFRDRDAFVMAPLFQVFLSAGSQYTFQESATLGKRIEEIFESAHDAIISAALVVKEDDINSVRNKIGQSASASSQSENIYNHANNSLAIDKPASATGLLGALSGLAQNIVGNRGGTMNVQGFDQLRNELSNDPAMFRVVSQEFLAKVKDADKYFVKVPIKNGIKCTVGKGVTNKLLIPSGADAAKIGGGLMLIADIMHDCYFDMRPLMATTTMRGVVISDVI